MLELKRIYWTRQLLRLAYAAATVWLSASVVLALLPNRASVDIGQRATSASAMLRQMFDGVLAAVALPGACIAALVIVAVVIRARDVKQQRREGMARTGGECEMEAGFRRRCSRPAEHGDHFYPWSKGGSTSLLNFVAACSRCNRAKGARIPSPDQQERLERRRRAYVTPDAPVSVGERQPLP